MRRWIRIGRPAALLCGFAAASIVGAQPEWERPVPLQDMQVTATGAERLTHEVAQAVTLIGRDETRRESPQVSAEILRGRVGTFFQQTTPGQGTAIIRGLKGSQVLHLVDGMRLNNAFFRSAPNQYLALVDPYSLAQTEIVRGTASTLYGADAMGGVVQMLTPEIETGGDWAVQGDAYGAYEHADRGRILRAEGLVAKDRVGFAGGATWQDYNDRRTGNERVRGSDYDSFAADGKLHIDISNRADLTLSAQYVEQPNTPRIDELVPGFGQDEPSSEVFSFRPNERQFYHARFRITPDLAWLDEFEAHLAQQDITDDRRTQEFGSAIRIDEANKSELTGLTLGFRSQAGNQLQLRYGVEIYQDDISSSRRETDLPSGLGMSVPARFPDGAEMDSVSGYLFGETSPTAALTISGGLRYSAFDIDLPQAGGGSVGLEPDDLSGDLHISWRASDSLNIVGNLGRGFRPPNIFDLGTLGVRPGNRFNIANEDLDSESVISVDAGVKIAGNRFRGEFFAFYSDYDDKITSVPTGAVTPDGRTVVRSENANQLEIYGIEAGGRYALTDRWELYGVFNYARGDEKESGGQEDPADRMPPLNGKLGVVYESNQDIRLDTFVLFADEQDRLSPRDDRDPRIDPNGTSGWATLNLNLEWRPRNDLGLGLRVENLFDKGYREHGSGIDARGASVGLWFQAGFSR